MKRIFNVNQSIAVATCAALSCATRYTAVQLISGDASKKVRPCSETSLTCTDFVGMNNVGAQRISGGDLLGLMDITAARTAMFHVSGKKTKSKDGNISVATIGTDNTVFFAPVLHGDVVEMRGSVVCAGSSSVGVFIEAFRIPFATSGKTLVGEGFFTMVAIDKDLKAAKVVPAVLIETQAELLAHNRYKAIRDAQQSNKSHFLSLEGKQLTAAELDDAVNSQKAMHVPISNTVTTANRLFFSGHLNYNNTIFGGEIMRWMEAHATFCGRRLTKNRNVYSIGMHSVSFNNPIFITDWVSLQARVAFIRNTTMEVDVKITVERDNCPVMTNRASFVLINVDEVGQKLPINTGLCLSGADQRSLRQYAMAKYRYEQSDKYRKHASDLHHVKL